MSVSESRIPQNYATSVTQDEDKSVNSFQIKLMLMCAQEFSR